MSTSGEPLFYELLRIVSVPFLTSTDAWIFNSAFGIQKIEWFAKYMKFSSASTIWDKYNFTRYFGYSYHSQQFDMRTGYAIPHVDNIARVIMKHSRCNYANLMEFPLEYSVFCQFYDWCIPILILIQSKSWMLSVNYTFLLIGYLVIFWCCITCFQISPVSVIWIWCWGHLISPKSKRLSLSQKWPCLIQMVCFCEKLNAPPSVQVWSMRPITNDCCFSFLTCFSPVWWSLTFRLLFISHQLLHQLIVSL